MATRRYNCCRPFFRDDADVDALTVSMRDTEGNSLIPATPCPRCGAYCAARAITLADLPESYSAEKMTQEHVNRLNNNLHPRPAVVLTDSEVAEHNQEREKREAEMQSRSSRRQQIQTERIQRRLRARQ